MSRYLCAFVIGLAAATPATAADLIGQAATAGYYFPNTATPYVDSTTTPPAFVIGAGQEGSTDVEGVTTIGFDFSAATLDIVFDTVLSNPTWNSVPFNGMIFTSAGFAAITGVAVDPSSTFAGFDASRATIVGDELRLNWQGLSYADGTTLHLTFAGLSGAVPEPASWALLIAGAGIVGASARRRRAPLAA